MTQISTQDLREIETYRWGPFPWSEDDASEPRVELPQATLLALVDAAETLRALVGWMRDPESMESESEMEERADAVLAKFSFGEQP